MREAKQANGFRIAPRAILAGALAISIAVLVTIVVLAQAQPRLGIALGIGEDGETITIEREGLAALEVHEVSGGGESVLLEPLDLAIEPDGAMGTYRTYDKFLKRQQKLSEIQKADSIQFRTATGEVISIISEKRGRSLTQLPVSFWVQLSVGVIAFLISAAVFAFRSGELSARYLLLSGISTLIFAPAAALYSTREFALPGDLFRWVNDLNFLGGSLFCG